MRRLCAAILVLLHSTAVCGAAVNANISRYLSIVERRPFGDLRAARVADQTSARPQPTAPPFTKDLKMCAITEVEDDVWVGFVDVKVKPPKSYYMQVGDTRDGITLVEADYANERALLEKGGERYPISMAGGDAPVPAPASPGMRTPPGLPGRNVSSVQKRLPAGASYKERLKRRQQALAERNRRRAEAPEVPALTGEEFSEYLKEYQMDLIRKGMPPLPIPLTQEMDDQLVEEGVLPPAE